MFRIKSIQSTNGHNTCCRSDVILLLCCGRRDRLRCSIPNVDSMEQKKISHHSALYVCYIPMISRMTIWSGTLHCMSNCLQHRIQFFSERSNLWRDTRRSRRRSEITKTKQIFVIKRTGRTAQTLNKIRRVCVIIYNDVAVVTPEQTRQIYYTVRPYRDGMKSKGGGRGRNDSNIGKCLFARSTFQMFILFVNVFFITSSKNRTNFHAFSARSTTSGRGNPTTQRYFAVRLVVVIGRRDITIYMGTAPAQHRRNERVQYDCHSFRAFVKRIWSRKQTRLFRKQFCCWTYLIRISKTPSVFKRNILRSRKCANNAYSKRVSYVRHV